MDALVIAYILVAAACGAAAGSLAGKKNRDVPGFALVGFLFGPIGVLVAAVVGPGEPPAPNGFVAVTCPRCNARQNVTKENPTFECYQCKASTRVLDAGGNYVVQR